MLTGATIFSGGEGVGLAMRAAGVKHLWGIEYDDRIANAARLNGFNSITTDARAVDSSELERPDVLHASPECKNASTAKKDGAETAYDLECAEAVCRFVSVLRPSIFTLENVYGYRNFQSFKNICRMLRERGYKFDYWHLNAADYGVPQTRKRLILIASLDFRPRRPVPTHTDNPIAMFDTLLPWVGWYEAIEDLIPTLPASQFAPWQLERLPKQLRTMLLHPTETRANSKARRDADEPSFTVMAASAGKTNQPNWFPRAFILGNNANDDKRGGTYGVAARSGDDPALTVQAQSLFPPKAFILDSQNGHGKDKHHVTRRASHEPVNALSANSRPDSLRAFVIDGRDGGFEETMRTDGEPGFTVSSTANHKTARAYIVDGANAGREITVLGDGEPMLTVTQNAHRASFRSLLACGRVVKMTPRALARFQSVPDAYELPEKPRLACTVVGNMVPPLLYQKIISQVLAQLRA